MKSEIIKILRSASIVSKNHKNIFSQLLEIIPLRIINQVGLSEYYDFSLWDDNRYTKDDKFDFRGWRWEEKLDLLANSRDFFGLVNDKFLFFLLMNECGIPLPKIYGIYSAENINYGKIKVINDKDELKNYILNQIAFPFFSKPNNFSGGYGAMGVQSIDQSLSKITLINNTKMDIDDYLKAVCSFGRDYVFQECLQTTPKISGLFGKKLTTLRVITLINNGNVKVFRVIWKLPLGQNMNDNFSQGKTGNLAGMVNRDTGEVERVVYGISLDQKQIQKHPETGEKIVGFLIPFYDDVKNIVIKSAKSIPNLKVLHWDIAITNRGPIMLEANIYGCNFLAQIAVARF